MNCLILIALVSSSNLLHADESNSAAKTPVKSAQPEEPVTLQPGRLPGVLKVTRYGSIYLAGQPDEESLPQLKRLGFETIVTLREAGEVPWDESAAVSRNQMTFLAAPFFKAEELTPAVFDAVFEVLTDKQRHPVLLHCGSANRVGAVWYAHRVLNDGVSVDEAEAEARKVGLRTKAYLEVAQQYVRQRLVESQPDPSHEEHSREAKP